MWFLSRTEIEPILRSGDRATLLGARLNEIDYILIAKSAGQEIEFRRNLAGWQITRPFPSSAANSSIMRLLDAFEQAKLLDYISGANQKLRELTPGDFGFDSPSGRVVLSGPRFRTEIFLGDITPLSDGLFATVCASDAIFVTSTNLLSFVNAPLESYADTRLLPDNPRNVNALIIRQSPHKVIKLARSEKYEWRLTYPIQARADWRTVEELFQALYKARIAHFYRDSLRTYESDVPTASAQDHGLDGEKAVQVQLLSPVAPESLTLTIGNEIPNGYDHVYARTLNNSVIVSITGEVRRVALKNVNDFRDRDVFPPSATHNPASVSISDGHAAITLSRDRNDAWQISTPIFAQADPAVAAKIISAALSLCADDFVSTNEAAELTEYNSSGEPSSEAHDDRTLSITVASTTDTGKLLLRRVANNRSTETQRVYVATAQNAAEGTFLIYDRGAITLLEEYLHAPHTAFDKTVLSIREKDVVRVRVATGEESEQIERVDGHFTAVNAGRRINDIALELFFKTVANLTAETVAAATVPESLFDRETNYLEITFDLADNTALRRVLHIGPPLEELSTGHYAAVKGRDALFVISREKVNILRQTLFAPMVEETP